MDAVPALLPEGHNAERFFIFLHSERSSRRARISVIERENSTRARASARVILSLVVTDVTDVMDVTDRTLCLFNAYNGTIIEALHSREPA